MICIDRDSNSGLKQTMFGDMGSFNSTLKLSMLLREMKIDKIISLDVNCFSPAISGDIFERVLSGLTILAGKDDEG